MANTVELQLLFPPYQRLPQPGEGIIRLFQTLKIGINLLWAPAADGTIRAVASGAPPHCVVLAAKAAWLTRGRPDARYARSPGSHLADSTKD